MKQEVSSSWNAALLILSTFDINSNNNCRPGRVSHRTQRDKIQIPGLMIGDGFLSLERNKCDFVLDFLGELVYQTAKYSHQRRSFVPCLL